MWETPSARPVRVKQGQSERGLKKAGVQVGEASGEVVLEVETSTAVDVVSGVGMTVFVTSVDADEFSDADDAASLVLEVTSGMRDVVVGSVGVVVGVVMRDEETEEDTDADTEEDTDAETEEEIDEEKDADSDEISDEE